MDLFEEKDIENIDILPTLLFEDQIFHKIVLWKYV